MDITIGMWMTHTLKDPIQNVLVIPGFPEVKM